MERISDIKKPKVDKRQYRYIELPNGLRCMLISDDEVERSAAALDVKVGSLHDPKEFPGLAHFCEHMLFLGTKKYPAENDYSMFIKNHGGDKNAFTSSTDTNYFFSISNPAFPEALDRFSQFFKEPLFNADSTDREIDAVDSEHKKNLTNDYRKFSQILLSHANPESRINRFSTGSAETLRKEKIRETLLDFHKENYSANIMTLALISKHPLDTLEKWALEHFSSIENKNLKILDTSLPVAYDESRLEKIYKVVPVSPKHILRVLWKFPDTRKKYKSKPSHYLSHVLGHEGPNSLLSYLIDEKLALSLVSYVDSREANTEFLTALIELTEKGLNEYERVAELAAYFAKVLREKGPQKYLFDELTQVERLKFDFRSQPDSLETVLSVSNTMHDYNKDIIRDVLEGPYVVTEYDPEGIRQLIDLMVPENMIIGLSSETCKPEAKLEEKWYKTMYAFADFTPELKNKLKDPKVGPSTNGKVIDLPPANILIPKNVDLLPKPKDVPVHPRHLKDTLGSSIWYKQDHKFDVPKAYGFCRVWTNDNGFPSLTESVVFAKLYLNVFFEDIREFMYMAEMAGIECKMDLEFNKLTMNFYGFNQSLPVLVDSFLKKMREFKAEKCEEVFHIKLAEYIKKTISLLKQTPFYLAMDSYPVGLCTLGPDTYQRLEILTNFTFAKFVHYSQNWLKNTRLEWYIAGNLSEEVAVSTVSEAEKLLVPVPMPKELLIRSRTVQIPPRTEYFLVNKLINQDEVNSCLVSYFQGNPYTDLELKQWAMNEVAFDFIKEDAFDYLRTKLQLGYVVDARSSNHNRVLGGRFLVQSAKMAPEKLYQKINDFLEEMWAKIKDMSEEQFKTHVEAVCIPLRQPPLNLVEESVEFWKEIANNEYLFERKKKEVEILESLKKAEVIEYFRDLFFENVKRYDYELVCVGHLAENETTKVENIQAAEKKGNKRIGLTHFAEMREVNFIYPDIYLLNMRQNKKGLLQLLSTLMDLIDCMLSGHELNKEIYIFRQQQQQRMEGLLEQFSGLKSGIAETREEIFTTLDFTLSSLESARDQIRGSKLSVPDPTEDDVKLSTVSAVTTLVKKLESAKPTQKVVDTNVEYYKHISKFGKSIGKYMNPSIEDTSYQVTFKPELVNQAIVDHLYKNGLVEAAEKLAAESKVMVDAENRKKYEELGEIRHELIHKKLEKVMTWVRENSAALLKMNSDTPFTVHKLQVLHFSYTTKIVHIIGERRKIERMH
eukprot:TRINITY_DN2202_c2_g1_i1.p1 TRINITY_DN2202_c2_g1~~TRINITY_DN2202_c2_g1_i1.p1  ORF type:complete len:1261 (+),score=181.96 TRINITY_DN2202_c2_g1_i1:85-3783(+)